MKLIEILEQNPDLVHSNDPSKGTDKHNDHDYIQGFYEEAFKEYQDKEITFVEIGIWAGGSLNLWSKYFTNAKIYGLEVVDRIHPDNKNLPNVEIIFENAYSDEMSKRFGPIDIVVDDGPHTLSSQVECLNFYLPRVKEGGILIIEDVQDTSWFDVLAASVPEELQSNIECVDIRKNRGKADDLIFVVRK